MSEFQQTATFALLFGLLVYQQFINYSNHWRIRKLHDLLGEFTELSEARSEDFRRELVYMAQRQGWK